MNTFGRIFRISIFGESHGQGLGAVVDGCPPGIKLTTDDFLEDIARRNPDEVGTTPRKEKDIPELVSGVFNDMTTGAPITILFRNEDVKSEEYNKYLVLPRPGHADFVASKKYKGFNDYRGGGMFSGRLTLPIIAAGVIAKIIIAPVNINAKLISAGGSDNIEEAIKKAEAEQDSIGGVVECIAENVPIALGEPFFDGTESLISHIIFSIPGVKAVEFGAGTKAAEMRGSEFNDVYISTEGQTKTNNAGGVSGRLTNGNDLILRVTFRPPSSIGKLQRTLNFATGQEEELEVKGRHDVCFARRTPVIVEAAVAIALADMKLIDNL
ncbi:MAG: chorismate synthase [Ignavibacteria bacterium GWB2_35_12]|nr:MAG: chorismate synthase [Ignavibacteria bacterium GWA2_35_8]OGU38788.1 MAG: chorismate synthase [Ignavibacteria bacterium GWB2_35_12]OGV20302.1 MAG: chorismate synthase [Ignavibacteria bacterium RIFOXYC2_FULL_35_21]